MHPIFSYMKQNINYSCFLEINLILFIITLRVCMCVWVSEQAVPVMASRRCRAKVLGLPSILLSSAMFFSCETLLCTAMELSQSFHTGLLSFPVSSWVLSSNPTLTHYTGLPVCSERTLSAKLATDLILRQGLLTSVMEGQAWLTNLINAFLNIAWEWIWVKRDIMCLVLMIFSSAVSQVELAFNITKCKSIFSQIKD